MHPALKAALLDKLDEWLGVTAELKDWPEEGLSHPELLEHMADAAEVVFDATYASSVYTINES